MVQKLPSVCDSCIHRRTDRTCDAFPNQIPDQFITWAEPHTTPISSQKNEIVWEFAPGTEPEFDQWKEFVEGV